jgi:hypothetical protein
VTKAEKLAHPEIFSPKGEYLIPKKKKLTTRTATVTVSRFTDFISRVSHSVATKLRSIGLLPYKTAASEAQTVKVRAATVEKKQFARIPIKINKRKGRRAYYMTPANQGRFDRLRERKLAGEYLPDNDWYFLSNPAYNKKDPELNRIFQS